MIFSGNYSQQFLTVKAVNFSVSGIQFVDFHLNFVSIFYFSNVNTTMQRNYRVSNILVKDSVYYYGTLLFADSVTAGSIEIAHIQASNVTATRFITSYMDTDLTNISFANCSFTTSGESVINVAQNYGESGP